MGPWVYKLEKMKTLAGFQLRNMGKEEVCYWLESNRMRGIENRILIPKKHKSRCDKEQLRANTEGSAKA